MASALLRNGVDHIRKVESDLQLWMEEHEYESVQQMRGSMSQQHAGNPGAFERAQYMRALTTFPVSS
jgi:dihydroorotate dehydrogenase (fumarate)